MTFLDLRSDFVFRALFTRSPNSLIDLLNDALDFPEDGKIQTLEILPSEIHKEHTKDKLPILDIKARSSQGLYNIELQLFPQRFYSQRTLYYWSRLYCGQINKGEHYTKLKPVYSVNFLGFTLIENTSNYKNNFLILEKDNPDIQLTEMFRMVFLELPKFSKNLGELDKKVDDSLDFWLYLIKNATSLSEDDMRTLVENKPVMQETLNTLEEVSIDPELLSAEEARLKSERDRVAQIDYGFHKGKAEGKAEGEAKIAVIVKNMAAKGHSISEISALTGVSEEEIKKLTT